MVTCQLVKLLFQLSCVELVGTKIVDIACSHVVILVTEFISEGEVEESVGCVLLVYHRQLLLGGGERQVFLEVEEYGLYRLHLSILYVLDKLAHLVTVGRYRCDGWLVYFCQCGVNALTLVHNGIAIVEEASGKIHHVFLSELSLTVDSMYGILPFYTIDECVDISVSSLLVVVERFVIIEFLVVDDAWQQVIGEVALLDVVDFAQQQLAHIVESLSFFWCSCHYEHGIVLHGAASCPRLLYLHGLVEVQVEESRLTIAQHVTNDIEGVIL